MKNHTSIVTIANQKGGVGKTTTVVNLASAYAQLGKKVLVIDMDYQANATSQLGVDIDQINNGASITTAIKNDLLLDKVRAPSNLSNVDVVAATRELDSLREQLTGQPNQFKLLDTLLDCDATDEYDIILVDTHPSLDCFFQSAMATSHYYIIPLFPEPDSCNGLGHQIQVVEKIRRFLNPMLQLLGCVITRFDRQNATHQKFEKFIRDASKEGKFRVFDTVVPMSSAVAASSAKGIALHEYKKSSPVTIAYSVLAGEILPHLKGKRTGRKISPVDTTVFDDQSDLEVAAEL